MSPTIFALVLFSAALHAIWNTLIKGAGDKRMMTVAVTMCAGAVGLLALPFFPPPARASWIFVAASGFSSAAYFLMVAATYRIADMSVAYPVMRGSAPLIVGLAGVIAFGEHLPLTAWLAIAIISAGIISMAAGTGQHGLKGLALAGLTAVLVALCTLIDAEGARRSQSPAAYTIWIFAWTGLLLGVWTLATRRQNFLRFLRLNWRVSVTAGFGALCSYGTALWAMTLAPVAVVAALRETTVLFGAFLAWLFLGEKIGRYRLLAIGVIAAGAMLLRAA